MRGPLPFADQNRSRFRLSNRRALWRAPGCGLFCDPRKDLIDAFFQRSWLMFHAVIVRRGYTDKSFHKSFDEEKRKRFTMLIQRKIAHFCAADRSKRYHVWVDPLPLAIQEGRRGEFQNRGIDADELGMKPLETLVTRRAKQVPGIQLADFLLGATLADWQNDATSTHKLRVRRYLAEHLGWPDNQAKNRVDACSSIVGSPRD